MVDVGVNLQHPPERDAARHVAQVAAVAEQCGLHLLRVSEHVAPPARVDTKDPYDEGGRLPFDLDPPHPEAMVLLGHLAGVTQTLRLGAYGCPVTARRHAGADVLIVHADAEAVQVVPVLHQLADDAVPVL